MGTEVKTQAEVVVAFILDATPYTELSEVGKLNWCSRVAYVLSSESNEQFGSWSQRELAPMLGIVQSVLSERLSWSRGYKRPRADQSREPQTALGIAGKMRRMSFKLAQRLAKNEKDDLDNTLTVVRSTIEILQGIEAAIESTDLDAELAEVISMAGRRTA